MGYLPFLLQVALFWWTPSTVAKKRYISPYINRGGGWNIFKIKIKWGNFTPRLPRKTKFLYSRADWFVQVSG